MSKELKTRKTNTMTNTESLTEALKDKRVTIASSRCGLCSMVVCAMKDATDEEILKFCNEDNPSGTQLGWCVVVRTLEQKESDNKETNLPTPCESVADRMHFLVIC